MNGPHEASSPTPSQVLPGSTRTRSDVVLTARNGVSSRTPRLDLRRQRSDGYTGASTSDSNNNATAEGEQQPLSLEAFQAMLRQVPPEDITRRDSNDPLRIAYFERRQRSIVEQAQRRRRAATTSAYVSRENAGAPVSVRPHAASLSLSHDEASHARSVQRHWPHASMDRPLPRTPSIEGPRNLNGEYIVPRWQPDAEASQCLICGQTFGLFFRRHHCRKCGRVVCANCSPHRITIPRQFIVHSPDEIDIAVLNEQRHLLGMAGDDHIDAALGGGQEVRLCNPCVPDPNPLPPPSYPSPVDGPFTSFPRPEGMHAGSSRRPHSHYASSQGLYFPPNTIPNSNTAGDSAPRTPTFYSSNSDRQHSHRYSDIPTNWNQTAAPRESSSQSLAGYRSPFGSAPSSSMQGGWPLTAQSPQRSHHRSHASTSQVLPSNRYSSIDVTGPLPPSPPPPPPPIREEDECPICHYELPPKDADGSETAREAHVSSCVESRFSSSSPRSARLPPESATAAAAAASGAMPLQTRGILSASPSSTNPLSSSSAGRFSSLQAHKPVQRRRTTGMVVYLASEKDCAGEDGSPQECVICFEEFAVEDPMGRLECLCKFHKVCIRQWWDTKGTGSCPVHQDGI